MNHTAQADRTPPATATPVSIPAMFVVLTGVSMVFLVGGAFGMTSPEVVPALASPAVAWSLISVGLMLDVAAVLVLIGAQRQRRR